MFALNRINRMGLRYFIVELPDGETAIRCNRKEIIVKFDIKTIDQSWYDWAIAGKKIQDAFPYLSGDEREFLMTAITADEWTRMMTEEEN